MSFSRSSALRGVERGAAALTTSLHVHDGKGNLDLFYGYGFTISGQLEGYEDGYYDNFLYMSRDGDYGKGQQCTADDGLGKTVVANNTVRSGTWQGLLGRSGLVSHAPVLTLFLSSETQSEK